MKQFFNLFTKVCDPSGELTRLNIEQITSATLDKQQYAQGILNKLTLIAGQAGTGRTHPILDNNAPWINSNLKPKGFKYVLVIIFIALIKW